jgi:flagellar protein FlaG
MSGERSAIESVRLPVFSPIAPRSEASRRGETPREERVERLLEPASPNEEAARKVERERAERAVEQVNPLLENMGYRMRFDLYEGTEEFYSRLIDIRTQEVIRQIPPEEILELHARLEEAVGLILDRKA